MANGKFTGELEIKKWKQWMIDRQKSEYSIQIMTNVYKKYFEFVTSKRNISKLEDITWKDFDSWKVSLLKSGISKNSVKTQMAYVISLYKMKRDKTQQLKWFNIYDRMRAVPKPDNVKESINSHKPIPLKTLNILMDAAKRLESNDKYSVNSEAYTLGAVLIYTAARGSSAYGLEIDEIKWNIDEIHFKYVKRGREHKIPLHKDLKIILKKHLKNRPYESDFVFMYGRSNLSNAKNRKNNVQSCERVIRNITKESGLKEKFTPHMFRKTVGTYLRSKGVDLKVIQAILGHEDFKMTADLYTTVYMEELKEKFNEQSFLESEDEGSKADLLERLLALPEDKLEKLLSILELM